VRWNRQPTRSAPAGLINDLISVLAFPSVKGQESAQIVSTLLDVLVGMLRLDPPMISPMRVKIRLAVTPSRWFGSVTPEYAARPKNR